jgi:hypothetical protein
MAILLTSVCRNVVLIGIGRWLREGSVNLDDGFRDQAQKPPSQETCGQG